MWAGYLEPTDSELEEISTLLELDDDAKAQLAEQHQRPRVISLCEHKLVALRTARYDDPTETVEFGELLVVVGSNLVVTIRRGLTTDLKTVRNNLEANPAQLALGPAAILDALVEQLVGEYELVVAGLDNDISEIEIDVFGGTKTASDPTQRIYKLKREVIEFSRVTKPLIEVLDRLLAKRAIPLSPHLEESYRSVESDVIRIAAQVDDFQMLLSDMINANLTQVGIRQNDDMRRMSAVAGLGLIPTVVGAIYGMNFRHMPELETRYGYGATMIFIVVACFLTWRAFRRAGWL